MEGVAWIYLAVVWDKWMAVVSMVINMAMLATVSFSSENLLHRVTRNDLGKIAVQPDVTHSTYLNMRGGAKDIQNACSNVFWFQSRALFQIFFRNRFCLHQSRTETLQHEEC